MHEAFVNDVKEEIEPFSPTTVLVLLKILQTS